MKSENSDYSDLFAESQINLSLNSHKVPLAAQGQTKNNSIRYKPLKHQSRLQQTTFINIFFIVFQRK